MAVYAIKEAVTSDYEKDVSVFNLGISADTTDDLANRFSSELEARRKEDMVFIFSIGVNDSQYEIATGENKVYIHQFKDNILKLLEGHGREVKIFVLGLAPVIESKIDPMPWKPTHGYKNEIIDGYNLILRQVVSDTDAIFIPMDDIWGEHSQQYLPDGLHPNAEGHQRIFERVKTALEKENIL